MKLVVSQLARLLFSLVALYGALLLVTALVAPPEPETTALDTARAAQSPYLTEPKYVFFGRSRLDSSRPKVLLLGASNTMAGLKQRELAPLLPGYEVHNISVGGANVTELEQIAQLVREVQSPAARRQTTYVIGLWYGVFATDRARWFTPDRHAGDTDIDIERYRYGFYRRTSDGAVPLVAPRHLAVGEALIRPYLVLDRSARDATASLRQALSGKSPKLSDRERNARVISRDEQLAYLDFWRSYMGNAETLGSEQLDRLSALVARVSNDGGRVILVDLPIPRWHSQGSALARDYRQRLERALPSLLARPGVRLARLADQDEDDDFSDEVHPKPRVSPRWAARLAEALQSNRDLSPNPTASNDHE